MSHIKKTIRKPMTLAAREALFLKLKKELIKEASELSKDFKCEILIVMNSPSGQCSSYASNGSLHKTETSASDSDSTQNDEDREKMKEKVDFVNPSSSEM